MIFSEDGEPLVEVDSRQEAVILRLCSRDGTNRLASARVKALTAEIKKILPAHKPLIVTGNQRFFSAGADLNEINRLGGSASYDFALMGQELMRLVAEFPFTMAAIDGYCMGGGLDLALACTFRIAAPGAIFGHRGAALGILTGWGGTQRLPRLVGKAQALSMFLTAEKLSTARAMEIGLISAIHADPLAAALRVAQARSAPVS